MRASATPVFTGLPAPPMPERPWPYGEHVALLDLFGSTTPADLLWDTHEVTGAVRASLTFDREEARASLARHDKLHAALIDTEMTLSRAVAQAVAQREHERSCATCRAEGVPSSCTKWASLLKATKKASKAYEVARATLDEILTPLAPVVGVGN